MEIVLDHIRSLTAWLLDPFWEPFWALHLGKIIGTECVINITLIGLCNLMIELEEKISQPKTQQRKHECFAVFS